MSTTQISTETVAEVLEAARVLADVSSRTTLLCAKPGLAWAEIARSTGKGRPWECGQEGTSWVCTCPASRWHPDQPCKHVEVLAALTDQPL